VPQLKDQLAALGTVVTRVRGSIQRRCCFVTALSCAVGVLNPVGKKADLVSLLLQQNKTIEGDRTVIRVLVQQDSPTEPSFF